MTDLKRPISESYWVEPGRLLAGEYPGQHDQEQTRKRIDRFLEAGFDTFIDLTRPGETYPYVHILHEEGKVYQADLIHERFPIGDFGLPTPKLMHTILDRIEQRLRTGRKIYLHCWGGIGRTGTTVGCYLVRQGKGPDEALNQLAAWWRGVPKSLFHPYSPETQEQVHFIRRWIEHEGKLRGTNE